MDFVYSIVLFLISSFMILLMWNIIPMCEITKQHNPELKKWNILL